MKSPTGRVNQVVTSAMLSQDSRADEAPDHVVSADTPTSSPVVAPIMTCAV